MTPLAEIWQDTYMNTYTLPHMTICSLCSEEIPAGVTFHLDDYLDAEDGTACVACITEIETHYSENPQGNDDEFGDEFYEDGDACRKFALENRD